jgi:hypothetical protein
MKPFIIKAMPSAAILVEIFVFMIGSCLVAATKCFGDLVV